MDILSQRDLDVWLADPARKPASLIGLDLSGRTADLARVDLAGCTLLGCRASPSTVEHLLARGGAMVSPARGLPFNPAPTVLYSTEDLYDRYDPADSAASWRASFDHANYRWFMDEQAREPRVLSTGQSIQARLHDTAIEAAVARFIASMDRPVVGFMGGHDTPRDAPVFATIAKLARRLTRETLLVMTGGGPGLMEAANLGAFLAPHDDDLLDVAIDQMRRAPKYDHPDWLSTAWRFRQSVLKDGAPHPGSASLGIPTWLYGFEPPNVFASHQAKMFFNSLREDGLVTLAGAGLIIGPGNAGTVQEIFQDATQNYYRKPSRAPTPIALLGEAYWSQPSEAGPDPLTRRKPLKPLLMALAGEKPQSAWSDAVLITDDVDAVACLILGCANDPDQVTRGEAWRLTAETERSPG